ncbi:Periostin [Collichthys lucidus]|uniref:Periostin n=1 Tax=Collichthys lucidus TaxID=240159 RepID=A0A4U5V105_COLLU|nr:Periostin [Collichthys lucidus]
MKLLFVAAFALFVLSTFDKADSSAYDKIVAHSRIRARKEGPNVCALQQVMGTKKKYFSTCRNWYQGAICGKKATVLYECCPGYMKLDGMRGCPAVAPIDNVYGTLGLVKATSTQNYADISKLRPEIEGSGSYTFFAPSNEAWENLEESVRSALVSNVNIELYNALHYHMANKRFLTKDLKNGMTVTSMYNDLGLQINHYSNGVVTVNCARIIYGNQVATNGVVHVIDRVISAVGSTIEDRIAVDDDLTTLNDIADGSAWLEKLGQPGHYTLFAPSNEAFESLGSDVLERLQALLNFHLLDSVQCSEAIIAGSTYETVEGNNIEIGCDGESLTVNGVKMVRKKDIVTTNGVIHVIDKVLMPDSAKQVMELVGTSQSTFGDMVSELGLSAAMRADAEYTLLAPLNVAFSDEVMSMDQRLLRIILESHILKNKIVLGQLYNGQRLETIGGKFLRVFIYRTAVCIENACLIRGTDVNALRNILLFHINNGIFIGGGLESGVTNLLKSLQGSNLKVMFANNTMQVNSVQVPESDIMATNGVIHFVNQVLYPAERIIQIVEEVPDVTKVTRVIESKPTLTKVTRVIESKPTVTKVTRVIEGAPAITKVTRVLSGPQYTHTGTANLDIEGADVSISHIEGTANFDPESLTKIIQGNTADVLTLYEPVCSFGSSGVRLESKACHRAFAIRAPRLWNELPESTEAVTCCSLVLTPCTVGAITYKLQQTAEGESVTKFLDVR